MRDQKRQCRHTRRSRAHLYIPWRNHYRLATLTRRIRIRTTHMATTILIITLQSIRIDTIQCLPRMNCQDSVEKDQQQPKSNRTGNAIRHQPCLSRCLYSSHPCSRIHRSHLIAHSPLRAAPTCQPISSSPRRCTPRVHSQPHSCQLTRARRQRP